VLRHLVDTHPHPAELGEARELLARSYYHSAQLGRAVEAAREALEHDPTNAYAALLLARALERSSRLGEADGARRMAPPAALGARRIHRSFPEAGAHGRRRAIARVESRGALY